MTHQPGLAALSLNTRLTHAFRPRRNRFITMLAVMAVLVSGTIIGEASNAYADDYPSWQDVQNARKSEAAKKAEIANIQAIIAAQQQAVDATQADADAKGATAQEAQGSYDEASIKADALKQQADAAQVKAEASKLQAGQLAARLARSGSGTDLSATIFFNGSKASNLLSQLGLASMVKDQSAGLYEKAVQDQNTAQSLTDQADVAKAALKVLSDAAQAALAAAVDAAQKAADALAAQESHYAELNAQLATLQTDTQHVEAEYAEGVKQRFGASASLGAGQISESGWARPAGGHITSPYGHRLDPYTHHYALHSGTDLGASCNSPIFAAHSGTVTYAGPYGGYGNYIRINNGDGTGTGYGHIVNGGILVHVGDEVGVGQNIAKVGSTGWSTGCHLHFEVYKNGNTTDPVPFMRAEGIELAN